MNAQAGQKRQSCAGKGSLESARHALENPSIASDHRLKATLGISTAC